MSWTAIIVICLICGAIAAAIGQKKNLGTGESFALGAILGVIGIVIVLIQKPGLPPAPAGMRAVKCPRCNTVQNIPRSDTGYECWQCQNSVSVKAVLPDP
jgi:hypothetical protein